MSQQIQVYGYLECVFFFVFFFVVVVVIVSCGICLKCAIITVLCLLNFISYHCLQPSLPARAILNGINQYILNTH